MKSAILSLYKERQANFLKLTFISVLCPPEGFYDLEKKCLDKVDMF